MNGDEACRAQASLAPNPSNSTELDSGIDAVPLGHACESAVLSDCDQSVGFAPQSGGMSAQSGGFPAQSVGLESTNPKDIAARLKRPLHLLPPIAEERIAAALACGADRYGPWNWREQKISYSNYIGAIKRHAADLMKGEDLADDSGCHHLAHLAATAMILLDALAHDCVIDDRPVAHNDR